MTATPFPAVADHTDAGCTPARRVRHEVRDAVAVMAFSAAASSALAALLLLAVRMGG